MFKRIDHGSSRQRGGKGAIRKSGSTPRTRTDPGQGNRIDPESVGRLSNCGSHSGNARKQLNQLGFSVTSGGYGSAQLEFLTETAFATALPGKTGVRAVASHSLR